MISGKKQGIFRPLVKAAWQTFCQNNNRPDQILSVEALDGWYHEQLVEHFGIFTSKQIPANDELLFERICLHFATISGDDQQITYWSAAVERRARYRLEITMRNADVSLNYVAGIARNMNLFKGESDTIDDLPAESILKLNTAVYLYYKRQKAKEKETSHADAPF